MSNSYFKFKEFTVNQDKTAMKVGTDGVLLGAWANCAETKKILDVGTGTGLIALMLAQRSSAIIDAVEIDISAFFQARKNFESSPWPHRLSVNNVSFQDYADNGPGIKYDLIVSNPPYFTNALKPENEERSIARHNHLLPPQDLINAAVKSLKPEGKFALIFPYEDSSDFIISAAQAGLFCSRITNVKPTPEKEPNRVLMEFITTPCEPQEDSLIIEQDGRHKYSEEYKELTKDFYLKF